MADESRKIAVPDFLMKSASRQPEVNVELRKMQSWRLAAALVIVTVVAFGPVLTAGFLRWDDRITVFENPDFLPARITNLGHYWTAPYLQLYMPVTYGAWGL